MIGFTQRLFDLDKPIEAVKKLNTDFGLQIDIGKAPDSAEMAAHLKRAVERKAYEVWEQTAWRTLCDYLWLMRGWRAYAPHTPDERCDVRFIYSLHHLDYAEYLCDEFIGADQHGRLSMQQTVSAIADFLSGLSAA